MPGVTLLSEQMEIGILAFPFPLTLLLLSHMNNPI